MQWQLTVSSFFEIVPEPLVNAEVETVPNVITLLVAKLRPLEYDLYDHPRVHGRNAEPNDPLLVPVRQFEQGDAKGCFAPRLAQHVGAR